MKELIKAIIFFLFPPLKHYYDFSSSQICHISFRQWAAFWLKRDKRCYWPTYKDAELTHPENMFIGINSRVGLRPGNYIQGNGGLIIGKYVGVTGNVGIISGNHDVLDHSKHINKEIRIGDYCWIGMNSMILPGVVLGPRTIVGAGSVVTKSFPDGYCVIAGNPARLIHELDKTLFVPEKRVQEYYGFVPKNKFRKFAQKHLKDNKYFKEIMKELDDNQL